MESGADPDEGGDFRSMGLRPELLESTNRLGWKHATPIQLKAIPVALEGMTGRK